MVCGFLEPLSGTSK